MSKGKPTLADVARLAGVSTTSVSFVLGGKKGRGIPEATSERIWRAACKLGYAKSSRAQFRDWTRVAYLTRAIEYFNSGTSFFANVYNHLQRRAVESRLELFLLEFDHSWDDARRQRRLSEMLSLGIEAILTNDKGNAAFMMERGLKTILVQSGVMDGCVSVRCDDAEAGRLAAAHALENGHRVAGTIFPEGTEGHIRYRGFIDYFEANGGKCPAKFRWTVPWSHAEAAKCVTSLASRAQSLPSLFYCFADNTVFPALRGLSIAGLKVPDDVSLIGTDNLYWGAHTFPAFTTVDLCEELFSEKLAEAIGQIVAGAEPFSMTVPVRLISRETVKRIPG